MTSKSVSMAARLRLTVSAALVAGVAAFGAPAFAQSSGEAPPPAAGGNADLFAGGWRKVSVPNPQDQSKPVQLITQEARDKNNVPIAEVTIMIEPDGNKRMLIVVPQGFLLPPGIRLQVDKNEPVPGQYITCAASTCQAEAKIDDKFIAQMKAGSNLVVAVATLPDGKGQGVAMTLSGFTAAFDGEALDVAKYKEQRKAFNEMLKQRAETNKQRFQQQREQNGGNAEANQ
ncbi:invasion associated locus B family protein [Tepidamorphus sp. 3E244]|uniref:invasion associated locus B family protein n=1 Tax=Tepidamorphus sp. 3E244 TaxID=3385498 RepID=UPI0038FC3811